MTSCDCVMPSALTPPPPGPATVLAGDGRGRRRGITRTAAAVAALAVFGAFMPVTAAAAQTAPAAPVPVCGGESAAVLVDASSEPDLYAAFLLAGVLDTGCLIDAGDRDKPLPAASRALLDTGTLNDGYAIGGTAAVPAAKLAGDLMWRRAPGADRWATLQLIANNAADPTGLPASTDGATFTTDSQGSAASDCGGESAAVLVDASSEPDLYAAFLLAGVLDTGCLIDAGDRDKPLPAASRALLDTGTLNDGYAIGGTAAVPAAKLAGDLMWRRAPGADRWATLQLIANNAADPTGLPKANGATAPMVDVVEYNVGDAIGGFPSGFAAASGNFSGASVSITGGGASVTLTFGHNGTAAYADTTYSCASAGGCAIVNGRVTKGTVKATTGAVAADQTAADLVVGTPTVSTNSPTAGDSFTLSATVRNQGNGPSASTTLRYYRSADANITAGDTAAGTDIVSRLDARQSGAESIRLTAPSTPGTYYYGACVDTVSDEPDTSNNCSTAVTVTVAADQTAADLVVGTPTVSTSSPTAGDSFTLSATVRNQGNGPSASTTLRYYRSADANITAGDTAAGTDIVSRLDARQSGAESIRLTAPSTPGTYYYGACVDTVSDEPDTSNNCSTAVTVTVTADATIPQTTGDCYVGLVVAVGERCTYPGSTNDFWVDSSGSGHFIFFTAGTGISARNTTINGVRYNFAASKQSDGTWIIEAAG